MDDSIIINFITLHRRLLLQKNFPKETYKEKKHEYFIKDKKPFKQPKDSEIAKIAIEQWIKHSIY